MERIANGVWYRKPQLAEITTDKKSKMVRKKDKVKASKTAKEVESCLFHYGCICKLCKEFDEDKERKTKGAVTSPAQAQATPDKGNLLDAKPQAKEKVSVPRHPGNSLQLLLDCMYPYRNHMETTCFANGATSETIWAPIENGWGPTGFSCR